MFKKNQLYKNKIALFTPYYPAIFYDKADDRNGGGVVRGGRSGSKRWGRALMERAGKVEKFRLWWEKIQEYLYFLYTIYQISQFPRVCWKVWWEKKVWNSQRWEKNERLKLDHTWWKSCEGKNWQGKRNKYVTLFFLTPSPIHPLPHFLSGTLNFKTVNNF